MSALLGRLLGRNGQQPLTETQALVGLFGVSTAVLGVLIADRPKPEEEPRFRTFREIYSSGWCTAFCGTAIMNFTDVAKVRMQAESLTVEPSKRMYTSFAQSARVIVAEEGTWSLLSAGIVSACYRDILYSGIRYGAYPILKRLFYGDMKEEEVGMLRKASCGFVSGGVGALIANPTDVVKIRMQREAGLINSEGVYTTGLLKGSPARYHNGFQAFAHILGKEGLRNMYAGSSATVIRAACGTGAQLSAYDHTKFMGRTYLHWEEGPKLHIMASLVSGLVFATVAAPADVIKAIYMSEPTRFSSPLQCAVVTVKKEGVRALFRGWSPSAFRICTLFVIMTPIYEQVRQVLGLGWFG